MCVLHFCWWYSVNRLWPVNIGHLVLTLGWTTYSYNFPAGEMKNYINLYNLWYNSNVSIRFYCAFKCMKIAVYLNPWKHLFFFLIYISVEMEISDDMENLAHFTNAFGHYSIAFWWLKLTTKPNQPVLKWL